MGLIGRVKSSYLIRNMLTLSLGTVIAQVIPIVLSPILSRIYSPADYGIWGVFSSTALICAIFMTGRYEAAILRPQKDSDAISLVQLCLLITTCVIFFIGCGYLVGKLLGFFKRIGGIFIISLLLYLFCNSVSLIFSYYANRSEKYKRIAAGNISRSTVQGISRICFGLFGFKQMGLILGTILGVFANASILVTPFSIIKKVVSTFSLRNLQQQAKIYKRFPLFELPSAGLNTLSTNIPLLLLAAYFSQQDIGYFSMAVSLMFLPISFITSAQSQVYYKQTCISDEKQIGSLTLKLFSANFIFGVAVLSIFELFAGNIFSIFLGERWRIAGDYAACFAPWILMLISFSPISTIFLLKDKQHLALLFNLSLFTARVIAVIIGGSYFHSMQWSMILYGIAGFFIWIIQGYAILKLSNRFPNNKQISIYISLLIIFLLIWIAKLYLILN